MKLNSNNNIYKKSYHGFFKVASSLLFFGVGCILTCTPLRPNLRYQDARNKPTKNGSFLHSNIRRRLNEEREVNDSVGDTNNNVTWKLLAQGESMVIPSVDPLERYFPTGVLLAEDGLYSFTSSGSWIDAWITCGPSGFRWPVVQWFNRLPYYNMFYLCGSINKNDTTAFPIGSETLGWSPCPRQSDKPCDGEPLYLFANDWWDHYENNRIDESDPLTVTITRTK